MSAWRIEFRPAAQKALIKLPAPIRARIGEALDRLAFEMSNPEEPKVSNLKAMHGKHEGEWRLRVGDYRVIFERVIREDEREGKRETLFVILVLTVGNRRDVYKG